tara:strand:+ start:557 stop:820 length:264 start_codon:yes stop_codon:yes gene_type:complete
MVKVSKTNASEIKAGGRIEFDNKEFVPMLDKDGNERMGSRGTLVKYGRVTRQSNVITIRPDKVEVRIEGRPYNQWLKHEELVNLTVL